MRPSGVILAAFLSATSLSCGRSASQSRDNVVLVSLDTLRADHLGTYSYHRATSPAIDALAREGVVFELAIAQAPSTLPSHRSIFQSRYASRTSSDAPVLAEVLRTHGYHTAAFTGGGNVSAQYGFGRGFEVYREDGTRFAEIFPAFEDWLGRNAGVPFFVFLHSYDVHLPYDPPPPFDSLFYTNYRGTVTGPKTLEICRKLRRLFEYENFSGDVPLTELDRRKIVALYDGSIRHADGFLGRLVELLKRNGSWDRTLLVVLSDHGEEFWDHGSVLHAHTVYQELIHVPLILRLPGGRFAGQRVPSLVRNMDVAPTILDLLAIPRPASFQGRSLLSLMRGESSRVLPGVSEMQSLRAWIEPPWKLIVDAGGKARLFDLAQDAQERRDVSEKEPARTAALLAALHETLSRGGAVDVLESAPGADADLMQRLRALGYVE